MREIDRSTDLGGYGYYRYGYLDSRDQRFIRSEKDEISIRFHDTKTDDVVWYAFTRFKRASDKYDQAGVDSLIQEVLTNFNWIFQVIETLILCPSKAVPLPQSY